jgi:hypothetical protein
VGDVGFDVVRFQRNVFEPLSLFLEESIHARLRIPILDEVKPTLVPQQDPGVELHASSLIVSIIPGFHAQHLLEAGARLVQILDDDTDVLDTKNGHGWIAQVVSFG